MKEQLIRLGRQLTESYQKTTLAKIQELREKAVEEAAKSSGEAIYNIVRIQAIFFIFIFLNLIVAIIINFGLETYAPDFYKGLGRLTGFLIMFGVHVGLTLLLPRFKKPVVQALAFISKKEVERRVDKRLRKLEEKVRDFDPEALKLPKKKITVQKVNREAATADTHPSSSKKAKLKKASIATGAGVVTMLVLRAVLTQKQKGSEEKVESTTTHKSQPVKQAAITLAAEAGKTLALELLRSLREKDED
ncbi:MAG: hypothetical protein AAF740_00925 [Bacteroidota bacterium]